MSENIIFIVGAIIFAVTVYGAVMAAGIALTRVEIHEDPRLSKTVDDDELDKTLPNVEY